MVSPEKAGSWADGQELFPDGRGDAEGGPLRDEGHLLTQEGGEKFPALKPEEGPDEAEGIDDLVGIDFFALSVGGSFFRRFEFDRFAFDDGQGLRVLRLVEDTQGILPVFETGNLDEFVQNGRLLFPSSLKVAGTDLTGDSLFFSHS
jgi:hypothetical protein